MLNTLGNNLILLIVLLLLAGCACVTLRIPDVLLMSAIIAYKKIKEKRQGNFTVTYSKKDDKN